MGCYLSDAVFFGLRSIHTKSDDEQQEAIWSFQSRDTSSMTRILTEAGERIGCEQLSEKCKKCFWMSFFWRAKSAHMSHTLCHSRIECPFGNDPPLWIEQNWNYTCCDNFITFSKSNGTVRSVTVSHVSSAVNHYFQFFQGQDAIEVTTTIVAITVD